MTDPTREQIDESSVQDPAWGVQMMAEGWSDAIGKANARIAELEKQVKQLTMLERMASQHASRCDANVAEADHQLAQAKAEIARLNAYERVMYADLLDEKVKAENESDVLQDRIAKAKKLAELHEFCDAGFPDIMAVLDGRELNADDDEDEE